MAQFNTKQLLRSSRRDFEKAWLDSAELLPEDTTLELPQTGTSHPFRNSVQRSREILIDMGFKETENRTFVSEADVYKQYGPEAPVILDRCFYLATLPRPELGLGRDKIGKIEEIIGQFDIAKLQEILRGYKSGAIESDDFVEVLATDLGIEEQQATLMLRMVFPELTRLEPAASDLTLRSHMTATWYHTLAAVQDRWHFPVALFSVGARYRNEQREDKGHLRVHNSTSMVVMDPDMSLAAGKRITLDFLLRFGFSDARFETKKATSKYYAPGHEQEVFARLGDEWLEIGDIGMYSPISLANFRIRYPVFNAGFGVERLAMIMGGYDDIRQLVFPQFYSRSFDDTTIEDSLHYARKPNTERGAAISEGIREAVLKHGRAEAPCRFLAYEDSELKVVVEENEEGKRLVGPAAHNHAYVQDGNIDSCPQEHLQHKRSFAYVDSIAAGIAADIERDVDRGKPSGIYRVKMARSLPDINLELPSDILNYITGQHKRIRVGGPVFLTVSYEKK